MSDPVRKPSRLRCLREHTVPYVLKPKTRRQKQVFVGLWVVVVAALVGLFIWGFPKLVDNVVLPTTNKLKKSLTKPQAGAILGAAVFFLPFVFITYDPAIWIAAVVLGFWVSFAIVEIGTTAGMVLQYLLGRRYLRAWTQRQIQKRETLAVLLDAAERVGPFKLQLLLRLGPIPYPILNYASGVPDSMTLLPFTAASVLGHLPNNLLAVYFGRNLKGISDLLKGRKMPATQLAYNLVGLVVSTTIVIGGLIYARAALQRIREEQAERQAAAETDLVQLRQLQPDSVTQLQLPQDAAGPLYSMGAAARAALVPQRAGSIGRPHYGDPPGLARGVPQGAGVAQGAPMAAVVVHGGQHAVAGGQLGGSSAAAGGPGAVV